MRTQPEGHVVELTPQDLECAHKRMPVGTPEVAAGRARAEARAEASALLNSDLSFDEVRERIAAEAYPAPDADAGAFWRKVMSRRGVLKPSAKGA